MALAAAVLWAVIPAIASNPSSNISPASNVIIGLTFAICMTGWTLTRPSFPDRGWFRMPYFSQDPGDSSVGLEDPMFSVRED
jgi:hypothetical protein